MIAKQFWIRTQNYLKSKNLVNTKTFIGQSVSYCILFIFCYFFEFFLCEIGQLTHIDLQIEEIGFRQNIDINNRCILQFIQLIQMDNEHSLIRRDNSSKSAFTPLTKSLEHVQKIEKEDVNQKQQKNVVIEGNQEEDIIENKNESCLQQKKGKKKLVEWTSQEDNVLFDRYIHNGPKWVQIAQIFPSKNDNDVKNRFYSCLKKLLKRLNTIQKEQKLKPKKPLGLDSLLTVLQIGKWKQNTPDKRFLQINKNIDEILQARASIIQSAVQPEHKISNQELGSLVERLLDLKHCLKFINVKRVKRCVYKDSNQLFNFEKNQSNSEKQEGEQDSEELKKKTEKSLNQQEDTSLDDQLYDIEKIEVNIRSKSMSTNMSLIESCKDILCPALVTKQQNDHLIFLF